MAGQRKLEVIISGDAKGLDQAVGVAGKSVGGLDKQVGSSSKAMSLGLAAVGVGALAMGKSFVDAASESQQVTKQTEAVLKSMGNQAGVTADDVAKLSDQLSKKSGVDDEVIQSGQNVLLTFGKVRNEIGAGNDVFNRATVAALDMSVALGTDLSSANIMLGKALNDPIKGMTALTRAGVSFTQQQKDQVAAMVASGDTLGAQKVILAELDKQFGGSAEAQATASAKMGVAWGNLQEQIGTILLPAFESVVGVATDVLGVFQALPAPIQNVAVIGGTLGAGLLALGGAVSFAMDHLRNMRGNLGGMLPDMSRLSGAAGALKTSIGLIGFAGAAFAAGKFAESITKSRIDVDAFTASLATADAAQQRGMGALLIVADRWGHLDSKIREAADANLVGAERMIDAAEAAGMSSEKIAHLREIIDQKRTADVQGAVDQQTNTAAMQDATAAAQGLDQSLQDVANALRAQFDPLFAAQDATLRLKEAQEAATVAARDHGAGSREAAAANDAAVRAAMGYESAMIGLKAAVDAGDVSLSDAVGTLNRWVSQGRITQGQADQVAGSFRGVKADADKIPKQVGITVTSDVSDVNRDLDGINSKLGVMERRMSNLEIKAARASAAAGHAAGGPVGYLAAGGVLGMHPGSPRGSDTVPAWLTPNEYVINARSAAALGRPVLDALNSVRSGGAGRAVENGMAWASDAAANWRGGSGAVVNHWHLHVAGSVWSAGELIDVVRPELERVVQRNGFAIAR